jgi:hypothetical protein
MRNDLGVTDGDAAQRGHVHESQVEVAPDRQRRVVGELEEGPELVPGAVVELDPDALCVGVCV